MESHIRLEREWNDQIQGRRRRKGRIGGFGRSRRVVVVEEGRIGSFADLVQRLLFLRAG